MKLKNSLAISLLLSSSALFADEVPAELATAHQPEAVVVASSEVLVTEASAAPESKISEEEKKAKFIAAFPSFARCFGNQQAAELFDIIPLNKLSGEEVEQAAVVVEDAFKRFESLFGECFKNKL